MEQKNKSNYKNNLIKSIRYHKTSYYIAIIISLIILLIFTIVSLFLIKEFTFASWAFIIGWISTFTILIISFFKSEVKNLEHREEFSVKFIEKRIKNLTTLKIEIEKNNIELNRLIERNEIIEQKWNDPRNYDHNGEFIFSSEFPEHEKNSNEDKISKLNGNFNQFNSSEMILDEIEHQISLLNSKLLLWEFNKIFNLKINSIINRNFLLLEDVYMIDALVEDKKME